MRSTFLPYEQPTTVQLLILGSFLLLLPTSQRVFQRVLSAGILGPLALGVVYGVPLADILPHVWQEACLALGYLGLILIVFEGGLSTRLDLLRDNLPLSLACALTGICCPIALSFAILTPGFGYPLVEAFILGTALSATSLGTTFAILGSLGGTRVGTIAMSAAMIDDVVGLIMASIVTSLNPASTSNSLGWSIGHPIMAAGLLTIFVPLLLKFIVRPLYVRYLAPRIISQPYPWRMVVLTLTLAGLCTGAAYAGTSILYGAYLAGVTLAYLDAHTSKMPAPGSVPAPGQGHTTDSNIVTYGSTFHMTIAPLQSSFLEPLFFASIGFAIPFRIAWQGTVVWRGLVYTLLMLFGKAVVGGWLPIWTHGPRIYRRAVRRICQLLRLSSLSAAIWTTPESPIKSPQGSERERSATTAPALLLGCMMVARGEIGLLILQLGYIQSGHVSDQGFLVGTWAVVLNTLIGPIVVGVITQRYGAAIVQGEWGDIID